MIQIVFPLVVALVCVGIARVCLTGPAPVVVISEPDVGGWVRIDVSTPAGWEVRCGRAAAVCGDAHTGIALAGGSHRLRLEGHGPHRVTWTVTAEGGGTTTGSVLFVHGVPSTP